MMQSSASVIGVDAIEHILADASSWADPGAEDQGRAHRTALLGDVFSTAQHMWHACSQEIDVVAEKLGDGSRDASWRLPYGDSGIVDLFLKIVTTPNLRPALKKHTLRIIGNSCADTDENRARVISSGALPVIIALLNDDDVLPFTISVLYNILVDYEPAQQAASAANLTLSIVNLLTSPRLSLAQSFLSLIAKLVALLATHESEATLAPPQTPSLLLTLALTPTTEPEDFVTLTAVAPAYLTHPPVQKAFIETGSVPILLATFYHLQTQLEAIRVEDEDAAIQLKALPQSFVQLLSDISYDDAFTAHNPIGSPVIQTLQSWLALPNVHLQSAACLCLGNVTKSDEASYALVKSHSVHLPPLPLLRISTDSTLLHAALSFLKNLAIPPQNKPALGDAGLLDADILPRIWSLDVNPQVQFSAVSLTRLLLVNTPPNVRRLCAPLNPDPLSPSHDTTRLHRLLDLCARTDAEHTKTEAARAAAAVCRVLHTTPIPPVLPDWDPTQDGYVFRPEKPLAPTAAAEADADGGARRRERFYRQHAPLNKALAFLVTQAKFPVLRSEAWFVFALMCRARDGAGVVIRALQVPGAFEAPTEAITGRTFSGEDVEGKMPAAAVQAGSSSEAAVVGGEGNSTALVDGLGLEPQAADPSQAAGMKKVDRENGLVMVSELVRRHAEESPAVRRAAFEEMLREGGEMLADEKGKGKET
ncbi:GTP binding protein [Colletotrichum kahawae]|uniref:GTP binding protein n=1 Tax=Colletotrichum kahawae TaxID=34407 RepID=A0AAD9Y0E2_COLKA|nr:GTP binding protein [Colletotrichum kahawae]